MGREGYWFRSSSFKLEFDLRIKVPVAVKGFWFSFIFANYSTVCEILPELYQKKLLH